MLANDRVDGCEGHVDAAGYGDVVDSPADLEPAVGMDPADVGRGEPTVREGLRG